MGWKFYQADGRLISGTVGPTGPTGGGLDSLRLDDAEVVASAAELDFDGDFFDLTDEGSGRGLVTFVGDIASFTPADAPGLLAWFVADDLDDDLADGANVTRWWSRAGHGNDSIVAEEATNPPILKTGIINGHDVVRFDGTNDRLVIEDAAGWSILNTKGQTCIIVFAADDSVGTQCLLGKSVNPYEFEYRATSGTAGPDGVWYTSAGGAHNQATYGTEIADATWYIATFWIDDTVRCRVWRDGGTSVADTSFGAAMSDTSSSVFIGERGDATHNYYDGDIAEILVWNRPLSFAELDQVHTYLADKYGIAVTACS
jgi:hypothetical protein